MASPIPFRTQERQRELMRRLLALPTAPQRLQHLVAEESVYYLLDGYPVVDLDKVAASPNRVLRKRANITVITTWVTARTGLTLNPQSMRYFVSGERHNTRPAIDMALAEFWRIDHRLLDESIPPSAFEDLDADEQRIFTLMNEIGLASVEARDIKTSLHNTPDADRQQLLGVLEGIARHRRNQPGPTSRD
jgi:hypothetical protein